MLLNDKMFIVLSELLIWIQSFMIYLLCCNKLFHFRYSFIIFYVLGCACIFLCPNSAFLFWILFFL